MTRVGDATVLGGVLRQAEQAARARPAIAQLADRAAAWFIGAVLVLAAGVAIGWLVHDPARMVPVLVSVLVVTCPCALSLATPGRDDRGPSAPLPAPDSSPPARTRSNGSRSPPTASPTRPAPSPRAGSACARSRRSPDSPDRDASRSRRPWSATPRIRRRTRSSPRRKAPEAKSVPRGGRRSSGPPCPMVRRDRDTSGRTEELRAETDPSAGTGTGEPHAIGRVEAPATRTGGVTGRIGGVRHAVGSPAFVARACGLDPGESGAAATGGDATAPSSRDKAPETADPADPRGARCRCRRRYRRRRQCHRRRRRRCRRTRTGPLRRLRGRRRRHLRIPRPRGRPPRPLRPRRHASRRRGGAGPGESGTAPARHRDHHRLRRFHRRGGTRRPRARGRTPSRRALAGGQARRSGPASRRPESGC